MTGNDLCISAINKMNLGDGLMQRGLPHWYMYLPARKDLPRHERILQTIIYEYLW